MKHVSILIPAGDAVVGSIEGPYKLLSQVNAFLGTMGRPDLFQIELVGIDRDMTLNQGVFTLHAQRTIYEDFHTDLIIIPAPHGDLAASVAMNRDLIAWIEQKYRAGSEVASLCLGAFLLAATGLMDGKRCATHWLGADAFRMMYPQVNLLSETIMTDEKGLYTSGGAYSYLNLVLYLVGKYVSHEMAVLCAKVYQIDMGRQSQSPFILFKGQKAHEDEPIIKAQEYIEQHVTSRITIDELASMTFISKRNFERRFKKATGNTVAEYIQRVKMEAAKMRLESSRENVNEVMYNLGYTDNKAFRKTFKKITGVSPLEYRNRYSVKAEIA